MVKRRLQDFTGRCERYSCCVTKAATVPTGGIIDCHYYSYWGLIGLPKGSAGFLVGSTVQCTWGYVPGPALFRLFLHACKQNQKLGCPFTFWEQGFANPSFDSTSARNHEEN